jgi:ferrous iron transport protein A
MKLNQLAAGEKARVISILGEEEIAERIMEMGLIEGTDIRVVRFAPLGDPIEIEARGYHLTLRKQEAALVEIERI